MSPRGRASRWRRPSPHAFEKWKAAGFEVALYFAYLSDAHESIRRIRQRVLHGYHDVSEEIDRRPYDEGLRNFFEKLSWLEDEWQFPDNSDTPTRTVATSSILEGITSKDQSLWSSTRGEILDMNTIEKVSHPRFPAVGEESLAAVRKAVRQALAEHGRAGRPVVVWGEGKVVEIRVDEHGGEVGVA